MPFDDVPRGRGPWPARNDAQSVARWLTARLGGEEAREAEALVRLLMDEVSGLSRADRVVNRWCASESELERLALMADRSNAGEPVQYILGKAHFFGLDFTCDERALIPRPETEELLAGALERVRDSRKPLRVLDIGTGTGILPIAWKSQRPNDEVHGLDIEAEALALAKSNATAHGLSITWHQVDALDPIQMARVASTPFDVILSNPPYIPESEQTSLSPTVREWEPDSALFVPNNQPLVFYERIAQGCVEENWLMPGGWLAVECHRDGAHAVLDLIPGNWPGRVCEQDLQGNWRMVFAQRPQLTD